MANDEAIMRNIYSFYFQIRKKNKRENVKEKK